MARRDLDEWLWQVGAELQRLSEEMTPVGPRVARTRAWEPRVDVVEMESHVIVKAELAGVRGDDIRIHILPQRNALVIRGVRNEEDLGDGRGCYHQLEIGYGEFEREVALPPGDLDLDSVRAHYRNGFLIVALPKSESAKPSKRRRLTISQIG